MTETYTNVKRACASSKLPGGCDILSTRAFNQILRANTIILGVLDIHKQEKSNCNVRMQAITFES